MEKSGNFSQNPSVFSVFSLKFSVANKGNLTMFRGATTIQIDNKGRLLVPSRYREEIMQQSAGKLVCTRDIRQPCLLIYCLNEWARVEQTLLGLSTFDPVQRSVQRVMLGYASECELDKTGRVLVPASLRTQLQLQKSVVLVGQLNKFELWNESQWQAQISQDLALAQTAEFQHCEALANLSL